MLRAPLRGIGLALAVALLVACDRGIPGPAALATPSTPPEVLREFLEARRQPVVERDPRLQAGDVIHLDAADVVEVTRDYRVPRSGSIRLPLVGTVAASGKRASALAREIERRLKEVAVEPKVAVKLVERAGHTAMVIGAVDKPGPVRLGVEGKTLVEAITLAGGLAPEAGGVVRVMPGGSPIPGLFAEPVEEPNAPAIEISALDLLRSGEAGALRFYLWPGDVVEVPTVSEMAIRREAPPAPPVPTATEPPEVADAPADGRKTSESFAASQTTTADEPGPEDVLDADELAILAAREHEERRALASRAADLEGQLTRERAEREQAHAEAKRLEAERLRLEAELERARSEAREAASAGKESSAERQAALEERAGEIERLSGEIAKVSGENAERLAALESRDQEIARIRERMAALEQERQKERERVVALEKEREKARLAALQAMAAPSPTLPATPTAAPAETPSPLPTASPAIPTELPAETPVAAPPTEMPTLTPVPTQRPVPTEPPPRVIPTPTVESRPRPLPSPSEPTVWVIGLVERPGRYPIAEARTVAAVVARAGQRDGAKLEAVELVRRLPQGRLKSVVNVMDVRAGRRADVPLEDGDTVTVPGVGW